MEQFNVFVKNLSFQYPKLDLASAALKFDYSDCEIIKRHMGSVTLRDLRDFFIRQDYAYTIYRSEYPELEELLSYIPITLKNSKNTLKTTLKCLNSLTRLTAFSSLDSRLVLHYYLEEGRPRLRDLMKVYIECIEKV